MKNYTITEEQIREAHNVACSEWQGKIERWFPQAFETKIEVGKWYKNRHKEIACPSDYKGNGYGFNSSNEFVSDSRWGFDDVDYNWKPATEKEVEEALIKEAKKRGYQKGNFKCLINRINEFNPEIDKWHYDSDDNSLYTSHKNQGGAVVFKDGKWAEIIEEIKEPEPHYSMSFETVGGVKVTLEGSNLDNIMTVANNNNLK